MLGACAKLGEGPKRRIGPLPLTGQRRGEVCPHLPLQGAGGIAPYPHECIEMTQEKLDYIPE